VDDSTGLIAADEGILTELESHSYPRAMVLKLLAANECNYVTASYFLSAEGKAEAARKLLPQKPWPFPSVVIPGRGSSRASSQQQQKQQQQPSASPPQASQQKQVAQQPLSGTAPPAALAVQQQAQGQQQDPRSMYQSAQAVRPTGAAADAVTAPTTGYPITVT
jgi:hypothetical protein